MDREDSETKIMGDTVPERSPEKPANPTSSEEDAAESAAVDVELQTIVTAWPTLSATLRAAVLAIAKANIREEDPRAGGSRPMGGGVRDASIATGMRAMPTGPVSAEEADLVVTPTGCLGGKTRRTPKNKPA